MLSGDVTSSSTKRSSQSQKSNTHQGFIARYAGNLYACPGSKHTESNIASADSLLKRGGVQ
jgi:hypothetical protein